MDLLATIFERLIAMELQDLEAFLSRLTGIRSDFEPLIADPDSSHLTLEYAILSNDITRTQSQIAELKVQQEEIKNFRVAVTSIIRIDEEWVIFTPASETTDITPEPRFPLNIATAAVLGFMVSIMAVFIMNFWKESDATKKAR